VNAAFAPHNPRAVRAFSALAAGLVVVQLLLLQQSDDAVRLADAIPARLLHFVVFGAIAAAIWLATGARWPLLVWAVFVLVGAIDETQQTQAAAALPSIAEIAVDGAARSASLLTLNAHQSKEED
jgi:hypothetical protein